MIGQRFGTASVLGLLLVGSGSLVSCSSSSSTPAASASSTISSSPATSTAAFCDAFKNANDQSLDLSTKEAWDQRLAATEQVAENAPPEQQANAAVFLQLVKDRVALVANYNYVSVQQLPADVRSKFIADHQSQQAQANELIASAKTTCNLG